MRIKNKVKEKRKERLLTLTYLFIVAGLILLFYGGVHILEWDRAPVIPKQDLEIHRFNLFGKSHSIIAEAYLKPDYNLIYSFEETPITLNLEFSKCNECPELENGVTFWFFYEKVDDSGSGGSIMSYSPDDLYHINIKPGEKKEFEGTVKFTGEGIYRHVLWNSTHSLRLESEEKTFNVYPNHIAYQIRSDRIIESFSSITAGTSFIVLAFISFQSYSNIESRIEQDEKFKKLLSEIKEVRTISSDKSDKKMQTKTRKRNTKKKV